MLGEEPLAAEAAAKVARAIERGSEAVDLPSFATDLLRERRHAFQATGFEFLERRDLEG